MVQIILALITVYRIFHVCFSHFYNNGNHLQWNSNLIPPLMLANSQMRIIRKAGTALWVHQCFTLVVGLLNLLSHKLIFKYAYEFYVSPFQDKWQVVQCIFISPSLCWTSFFIWRSGRHAICWQPCSMSALCLWASMESPGPVSAERETTSIQFMEKPKCMVVRGKSPALCWCLRVILCKQLHSTNRGQTARWRPGLLAADAAALMTISLWLCLISGPRSNYNLQCENAGVPSWWRSMKICAGQAWSQWGIMERENPLPLGGCAEQSQWKQLQISFKVTLNLALTDLPIIHLSAQY